MTGEHSRRQYLAGAAVLLAGCSRTPKLMGQPTRTAPDDAPPTRRLSFGEPLELPDVRVTVEDPRFRELQTWTEDGQRKTAKAGEDHQWLFVRLVAANTASEATALPQTMRFEARVGDALYKPGRNHDRAEKYVGGQVPAGERRSGDVGFLVPRSVSREDVAVLYEETRDDKRHRVLWE